MTDKDNAIYIPFPEGYPELLEHMGQVIGRKLVEYGMAREEVKVAAVGITDAIMLEVGGGSTYIPRGLDYMLSQRDRRIFAEFKGNNYSELARKYHLSAVQIRNIVNKVRSEEMAKRQGKLL